MRAAFAVVLLAFSCVLAAQPQEHQVKAAFLFKFPSFVEWPKQVLDGDGPLVIGVAGADDVAQELQQMAAGRSVQGRSVAVRRVLPGEALEGLHVLFLARGQRAQLFEAQRQASAQPLLIVCDWEGALQDGAVVNFVRSEGRIRFEVAVDAAERRGLRISARMLAVAQYVRAGRL